MIHLLSSEETKDKENGSLSSLSPLIVSSIASISICVIGFILYCRTKKRKKKMEGSSDSDYEMPKEFVGKKNCSSKCPKFYHEGAVSYDVIEESGWISPIKEIDIPSSFGEYFGRINNIVKSWSLKELGQRCASLKIQGSTSGERRGKIKNTYKQFGKSIYKKMSFYQPNNSNTTRFTYFDYLVVIDFEATCYDCAPPGFVHEIIQFPAVLVNVRRQAIVDDFSVYVKPTINSTLSAFCTNLTGITQEQVDKAPEFPEALKMFKDWLASHRLGTRFNFAIVCDGSYDMGRFMYAQCEISEIPYYRNAYFWVNIRKCFKYFYSVTWVNLRMVLDILGNEFVGRPHNGLDDARNIARVLVRLIKDGCLIVENERIVLSKAEQEQNAFHQGRMSHPYCLATVQTLTRRDFILKFNLENRRNNLAVEEVPPPPPTPPPPPAIEDTPEEPESGVNKENVISSPSTPTPTPRTSKPSSRKRNNKKSKSEEHSEQPNEIVVSAAQEE